MFHRKDRNCLDFHFIKFRVTTLKDYSHKFSIIETIRIIILKIYIIICIFYDKFSIIKQIFDSFSNIDLFAFPFFFHQRIRMDDQKKKKKNEEIKPINVQNEVFARFISHSIIIQKNVLKVRFLFVLCRIISS